MQRFSQQAEQIGRAFKTPTSSAWVIQTGRRDLVNGLLDAMRRARSPEQFDAAVYQFKRQVLLPYYREVVHRLPEDQRALFIQRNPVINIQPRKPLGTYDELKRNPAFAESQYQGPDLGTGPNPQLLRIVDDPVELDLAARSLGVTPEDLQAHIRQQYDVRARKQLQRDMLAMAEQSAKIRNKIADEYANSLGGTVLGIMSPEVTGLRLKQIRSGEEPSNWELAQAIAKDALVGLGSLATGGVAGKFVTNPAARALVSGGLDAGLEAARQGMSNYYDWDPLNIAATGGVSATMPSIIGGVAEFLGNLGGGMRRVTRPVMKKLLGMTNNPADVEAAAARELRDRAARATEAAYEGGDLVAREGADDLLDEARTFMEGSPQRALDPEPLTKDKVRDIVMDPALASQYFEPPTRENFLDAIVKRNTAGAEDVMNVGGKQRYTSDVAEDWLGKAKTQWPETWKAIGTPPLPETWWDKVGSALVDIGSREETMRQRAKGKKMEEEAPVSPSLQYIMKNDPQMIQMWQAGFAPHGDNEMMKVYNEWKSRFGG